MKGRWDRPLTDSKDGSDLTDKEGEFARKRLWIPASPLALWTWVEIRLRWTSFDTPIHSLAWRPGQVL